MRKWKRFERLTAALRAVQGHGATVKWNDMINGWQVDVSVRIEREGRVSLEIIECRDHGRRVTQEQMAAFVTNIQETGADSGSFVSAAGFQKGAKRLARKRGVTALTFEELPAVWPDPVRRADMPYVS